MFPEDRVIIGVINRKRDLDYARQDHWYRIPQTQMPRGVHAEYLAFFLSGKVFKDQSGAIHHYARVTGIELVYRRDLLPAEAGHPRAGDVYYRIGLGDLLPKEPPIRNPTRRPIAFVYTTWDRFVSAAVVADLYSRSEYFVDRIYHALRSVGVRADRFWEAEKSDYAYAPGLRVLCENGVLDASAIESGSAFYLDETKGEDVVLAAILDEVRKRGGPVTVNLPSEGF
jgi:hypothetical protein